VECFDGGEHTGKVTPCPTNDVRNRASTAAETLRDKVLNKVQVDNCKASKATTMAKTIIVTGASRGKMPGKSFFGLWRFTDR